MRDDADAIYSVNSVPSSPCFPLFSYLSEAQAFVRPPSPEPLLLTPARPAKSPSGWGRASPRTLSRIGTSSPCSLLMGEVR